VDAKVCLTTEAEKVRRSRSVIYPGMKSLWENFMRSKSAEKRLSILPKSKRVTARSAAS